MHTPAATTEATLQRFCLAHDEACVVPAEALLDTGIAAPVADWLLAAGRLTAQQLHCLEAGHALYQQRCRDLHARAPRSWFPPRRTNLLIAARTQGIAPYLEPFGGTSSLLYACDLDTHPEYVAALLLHMERLSLLRSVPATIAFNLSYWFARSADQRQAFATAARAARRPDAPAFAALADALEWIDELLHDPLRAPAQQPAEPYLHIDGADLYVPRRLQPRLMQLTADADGAVRAAVQAHTSAPTLPDPATAPRPSGALDELCDWLQQSRAHVVIHGPHGGTLWTPEHDDPVRVRRVLAGAGAAAVASIHADLAVVDARSRQFLACVAEPDALPSHCAVLETGGGAYLDAARRAVVYELQQPAFDAQTGAAPPYHRLLLGARVMHEWGHLAHAAKLLHVPDERRAGYHAARADLGECFARVLAAVPDGVADAVRAELADIEPRAGVQPAALARKTLARVGDYLSNMMAARLIPGEEMQAYVRTNVRHHLDEQLGIVSELARYAYEIHYLALAGLPRSYFYETSRFPDYYIATGIVTQEDAEQLFDAAGRVLACYAIDGQRLRLPPLH